MNLIILIGIPAVLVLTCMADCKTNIGKATNGAGLSAFTSILITIVLLLALHNVPGLEVSYSV